MQIMLRESTWLINHSLILKLPMYHNNYFTCTLLNSDKNSARAKVAGNGKSPEEEREGGFLEQTIWMGRYWWILPIYK